MPVKQCSENGLACKEQLTALPTPLLCLRELTLGLAAEMLPADFPGTAFTLLIKPVIFDDYSQVSLVSFLPVRAWKAQVLEHHLVPQPGLLTCPRGCASHCFRSTDAQVNNASVPEQAVRFQSRTRGRPCPAPEEAHAADTVLFVQL